MKTIFVIYTNTIIKETVGLKRYCFNTENDIKVGDMIKSPNYETTMQVVEVLENSFKYFNHITGDLTNELTSTKHFPIRELRIREEESTIVYGTILK